MELYKTCSSLINICSLSLSKRPWRPPLCGLMNTTIGDSGDPPSSSGTKAEPEIELAPGNRLSPALGSCNRMESLIAKRRYCGIRSFFPNSSLSIRNPVNPHPLNDSIMEDRAAIRVVESPPPLDVGESIIFKGSFKCRIGVRLVFSGNIYIYMVENCGRSSEEIKSKTFRRCHRSWKERDEREKREIEKR